MSLKGKLQRMKNHLSTNAETEQKKSSSPTFTVTNKQTWEENGYQLYESSEGYCFIKKQVYPLDYKLGKYTVHDFINAVQLWQSYHHKHPLSAKGYQDSDLFFFDTESTGLGHGVGNHLFILGHARMINNELVLTQHILPEPGFEVPLYESFLKECNVQALVTYNGKAFDWPLVETKHALIRNEVPKLPSFGHFDLFHACKRLFKHELPSMKLAIIEKDVLDITRGEDVPGYLSGMIYQDFLQRKDPEGMFALALHNERDILSLVALYTHLSFLVHKNVKATASIGFEIGRWEAYEGNREQAILQFEQLAQVDDQWSAQVKYELACQYKKDHDWEKAVALWMVLAERGDKKIKVNVCIELAKYLEHKDKKFEEALIFTNRALDELAKWEAIQIKKRDRLLQELMKRKIRLLKKLS
ncbi:metal-dependent exonucleaseMrfB [Bacillus carboniphilus]|uniref:Metal-dependent exonucleaseMrfB n=1 Tax=Bacillus carboniphilus TaxID=86663 RepID=A0ABP3GK90_9BACI